MMTSVLKILTNKISREELSNVLEEVLILLAKALSGYPVLVGGLPAKEVSMSIEDHIVNFSVNKSIVLSVDIQTNQFRLADTEEMVNASDNEMQTILKVIKRGQQVQASHSNHPNLEEAMMEMILKSMLGCG